jgi:hypothetical protein
MRRGDVSPAASLPKDRRGTLRHRTGERLKIKLGVAWQDDDGLAMSITPSRESKPRVQGNGIGVNPVQMTSFMESMN